MALTRSDQNEKESSHADPHHRWDVDLGATGGPLGRRRRRDEPPAGLLRSSMGSRSERISAFRSLGGGRSKQELIRQLVMFVTRVTETFLMVKNTLACFKENYYFDKNLFQRFLVPVFRFQFRYWDLRVLELGSNSVTETSHMKNSISILKPFGVLTRESRHFWLWFQIGSLIRRALLG